MLSSSSPCGTRGLIPGTPVVGASPAYPRARYILLLLNGNATLPSADGPAIIHRCRPAPVIFHHHAPTGVGKAESAIYSINARYRAASVRIKTSPVPVQENGDAGVAGITPGADQSGCRRRAWQFIGHPAGRRCRRQIAEFIPRHRAPTVPIFAPVQRRATEVERCRSAPHALPAIARNAGVEKISGETRAYPS